VIKKLVHRHRRGAAAVELAIVTPVLLTMLFGIIEYGWVFTVRQAVVTAAREGARTAALPAATQDEVLARVNAYVQPLGLTTCTTDVGADENGRPTGVVTVSIPYADVSLVGCYFGNVDGTLQSTCSMRKEAVE